MRKYCNILALPHSLSFVLTVGPEGDDSELREKFGPVISLPGVSREISNVPILYFIIVVTLIPLIFLCVQLRLVLTTKSFSKMFQRY